MSRKSKASLTEKPNQDTNEGVLNLQKELSEQYDAATQYMQQIQDDPYCTWTDKEAMFMAHLQDKLSDKTRSQVFDPRLSTIAWERSARVMAQLPTGKVQADLQKDKVPNTLADLLLHKHIIPNANDQYDLMTKFRLENTMSNVYGSFGHLVMYRSDASYRGADMNLIPIRNIKPQSGAITVQQAQYVFIDSYVSVQWCEARDRTIWKGMAELLEKIKKNGGGTSQKTEKEKTYNEQTYHQSVSTEKGKYAQIKLVTRYENDRWVTFAPDYDNQVVRDIKNPNGNDVKPIILKHAFPLLDRFIGLGDFERGKTLQYSINSLINMTLDGHSMAVHAPLIVDPNGVVMSSLRRGPGAIWRLKGTKPNPNAIREHVVSSAGMNQFVSTYQFLNSALLYLAGTTDTTVSSSTDMTQGKTPEALRRNAQREAARDNWDRYLQEKAIEETYNQMLSIMVHTNEAPVEIELFEKEIEDIKLRVGDESFKNMFSEYESGTYGKLKIKPDIFRKTSLEPSSDEEKGKAKQTTKTKNIKLKYIIDFGSSAKADLVEENQKISDVMDRLAKIPGVSEQIVSGKVVIGNLQIDFGELIKRYITSSGAQNLEKIVSDAQLDPQLGMPGTQGMPPQPTGAIGTTPQNVPQQQFDVSAFQDASQPGQQLAQLIAGLT